MKQYLQNDTHENERYYPYTKENIYKFTTLELIILPILHSEKAF